jgi:protein involved in polysaccharide export with SLBB domain
MNRVYYVGGEVAHPGPEVYIGSTTVTTAVQAAGDLTQFGSHRVWLTRADGTRIKVNLDKALSDSTQDPPVFPGDKIQVPRRLF